LVFFLFLKRSKIDISRSAKFFRQSLSGLLPEILERFQVVDDVCHGSAYAFATTQRG